MSKDHIAVIDIGKTNAKLALVDPGDLSEVEVITRPNTVQSGPPWPHFDVEGHWQFILNGLGDFHRRYGISAISVTTHGACAALLAADGSLAAPILDYEYHGPDTVADAYDTLRPPFSETGSARLGQGLNIGAQLHWQFQTDPSLKQRTTTIVTYPQFWGYRLTGVAATDVTSLGCHTDLWNPTDRKFSSLVERLGLSDKIAPPRKPSDVLGSILPDIAARTGLAPDTPVLCGIHDSNASLIPHVLNRKAPFSVVSTGTWVIVMSVGGLPVKLDPNADTLINVNALGDPVPSARFMGGREFDILMGMGCPDATAEDLKSVVSDGLMLLPAVVPDCGPFRGKQSRWIGAEPAENTPRRTAVVSLYLALVTLQCLENIGHSGPIVVEGPFTRNNIFLQVLSVLARAPVHAAPGATGTSQGAALLAAGLASDHLPQGTAINPLPDLTDALSRYAAHWRKAVGVSDA